MTDQKGSLRAKLRRWWEGEYLPDDDSSPGSVLIRIGGIHVRARSAVVAEAVLRWFGKNYWQFIGAVLTTIGLVIAAVKL